MRFRILIWATLASSSAGCSTLPSMNRVAIPETVAIRRITVEPAASFGLEEDRPAPSTSPAIEDRDQIARIAGFLAAHSRGWREPWGLVPNSEYHLVLEGDHGSSFHLGIGDDWIGNADGHWNRFLPLSPQEMGEFRGLLGIPPVE